MLINLYLKVRKIECLKIINNNNLNKFNKPIDLIMWIPIIIMKQCSFNLHRIRIYRILRIKLFNPKMKFKISKMKKLSLNDNK